MTTGRALGLLATLGAAGLLACAGCSSSLAPLAPRESGMPPSSSPTGADAPAPAVLPTPHSVFPITGLPATNVKDLARPAVAVVVAAPDQVVPVGLQAADMVVEEVVQPGSRRLLAVFQSRGTGAVGPVGEARPLDSVLLPGWRAMYAYLGGKPGYADQARAAGAVDVGATALPAAYTRPPGGPGVLVSLATTRAASQARTAPRAWSVMSFVAADAAPATSHVGRASRVVLTPPGHAPQSWVWNPGRQRYLNRATGVEVTNLVVRTVAYKTLLLPGGGTEPSARVLGRGAVTVASGGRVARGTWAQQQAGAQVHMLTRHGTVIELAPGPTWVLLAPPGTAIRVT